MNQSHVHQPDPERVGAGSATASTCTTTSKVKEKFTDQSRNGNTQPNVGQEQPSEDAGRARQHSYGRALRREKVNMNIQ